MKADYIYVQLFDGESSSIVCDTGGMEIMLLAKLDTDKKQAIRKVKESESNSVHTFAVDGYTFWIIKL